MALSQKVQAAGEYVGELADEIKKQFKPPMRITILVRMPDHPDGSRDFILTDDTLDEVVAAIARRKDQPSLVGAV